MGYQLLPLFGSDSFGDSLVSQAKKMSELKNQESGCHPDSSAANGRIMSTFKDYDLESMCIPEDARPRVGGNHLGNHGYTLRSSSGAVP